MPELLLEISRQLHIQKTKSSDDYAPNNQQFGRNRYQRRTHLIVLNSVAEMNQINMNKLFKLNILDVNVRVQGETDMYLVRISFGSFLDNLHNQVMKEEGNFNRRTVIRALVNAFNGDNVYVRCSCPDFCLHEDTQIKLLNGEVVPVKDMMTRFLSGEDLWVYSTDEKGDFKPGHVTDVWVSGEVTDLIKITLDNGKQIITTPNHRYMMRNGEYVKAQDLHIHDSLMPLYFNQHNGYEGIKKNSIVYPTQFESTYKLVANELLQEQIEQAKIRSGEDIIAIHHSDFNKCNNYPSNLQPMGKLEHWEYHYNHVKESGQLEKFIEAGRKYNAQVADHTTDEYKKQAEVMSNAISNYWNSMTEQEYAEKCLKISERNNNPEIRKKFSDGQRNAWANYTEEQYKARCEINRLTNQKNKELQSKHLSEAWEKLSDGERKLRSLHDSEALKASWSDPIKKQSMIDSRFMTVFQRILDAGEPVTEESYAKFKLPQNPRWQNWFNTFEECKQYFNINHIVADIEYIHYDTPQPVYDISVDKWNNFFVDAGVVLHNCYRLAYWLSVNGGIAGDPELRPSDETNPNDTKGSGCKHIQMVLSNNVWLSKVASVIYNYVNYMKTYKEALYSQIIYPAIFEKEYTEPVQMDLFDKDELSSTEDEIDISNKWAKTKNQILPGWNDANKENPEDKEIEGLKHFNLDSLISD